MDQVKKNTLFSSLVSQVEQLMSSNPQLLLSGSAQSRACYQTAWDIVSSVLLSHSSGVKSISPSTKIFNVWGDVNIVDAPGGNVKIVNNKWVPFGIDSLDLGSNTTVGGRPWWVKCRDSWSIFLGGEEITYPIGEGSFITCLSKAPAIGLLPLLNPLVASAYDMVTMEDVKLALDKTNLSEATRMRAMAEMKGKISWNIFLIIRAVNFIPAYGDVASFAGEVLTDMANDPEMNSYVTFPYALVTAKGGIPAAKTYTGFLVSPDSGAAGSLLHRTAKKLMKDGRKTKLIKSGGKLLKNALMVPDLIDAGGFLLETVFTKDEFCFKIDQNSSGVATISPYSFYLNEECDSNSVNGDDEPDTRLINMGQASGTFSFSYDTYSIRDKIVITHDDQTIFDTGCVGSSQTVDINFSGKNNYIVVQVYPNCAGTSGTGWDYNVSCPD